LTQDKKVNRLGLLVYRTPGGCLAWGRAFDQLDRLPSQQPGDLMDSALSLWTADLAMPLEPSTGVDARVCLVMDQPGPAEVLGMIPSIETNERA
jgi:hypothetical protein